MRIYLFFCSSRIDVGDMINACNKYRDELKIVPLPCSGKIDIRYLTKSFETGADGVVLVTCKQGECRYLEGSLRARKRMGVVEELLEEIGIGAGRTMVIEMDEH